MTVSHSWGPASASPSRLHDCLSRSSASARLPTSSASSALEADVRGDLSQDMGMRAGRVSPCRAPRRPLQRGRPDTTTAQANRGSPLAAGLRRAPRAAARRQTCARSILRTHRGSATGRRIRSAPRPRAHGRRTAARQQALHRAPFPSHSSRPPGWRPAHARSRPSPAARRCAPAG